MILVTASEMRRLDERTIELGTPGYTLMERAGAGAADLLLQPDTSPYVEFPAYTGYPLVGER